MTPARLPGTELSVSPLCLGTADFGTRIPAADAGRVVDVFLDAGGNFFDTAHCYAFWADALGEPERILGRLVAKRRDRVILATKGGHPPGGPKYPRPDRYLSPKVIATDIDESLQRLGVDRIDLYYLHRDDVRVPAAEVIETLNAEVRRGRIRYPAASNWAVERIGDANAHAAAHGLVPFAANQPQWSLAAPTFGDPTVRTLSDADVAWHARSGLAVVVWSPTANGYFAGRSPTTFDAPANAARRDRAEQLARELNRSANQVALAWLTGHPFPVVPIVGTGNVAHLRDAVAATGLKLTAEQVRWLKDGGDAPAPRA